MRRCLFLTALILAGTAIATAQQGPGAAPVSPDIESFDRFIGRDLVVDHRASKAGLHRSLPLACPPFFLKDEEGKTIDPRTDWEGNPVMPTDPIGIPQAISMRKTCGQCHDYDRVVRGYHFTTGRDEMFEMPVSGEPHSVHASPGFFGKWQLLYQRELAPKAFDNPDEIDMTPFEWVVQCGVCHPGGGPAEFDRSGRRYDQVLAEDRGIAMFGDGDYWEAPWDRTGVMEADCFICHLDGYEYSVRAQQIKKLNFRWAATAASGIGYVWGSVLEGQTPNVYYDTSLFRADGTVHLPIQRPTDRQCLYCHDMSSVQKRGSTWRQHYEYDVHTEQGLTCTQCHVNDIRHNFAKGDSSSQTVRDDLDNTALSCKECHEQQVFGAPDYKHEWLPALHLERISCEACHIVDRPFTATQTVDTTQGDWRQLPLETELNKYDSWMFGAMWGVVRGQFDDNIVSFYDQPALLAAADTVVAPDSPMRAHFAAAGGSALPEGAFTVREFIEAEGGLVSEEARSLMLLVLAQGLETDAMGGAEVASADRPGKVPVAPSEIPVCVFRGKTYFNDVGGLQEMASKLQPKRPGATIAESKFTFAKYDGMVHSEGYQLAAYWVYIDDGHVRPVFLKDMKAAWRFLQSEEYRCYVYPGETAGGEPSPAWPAEEVPAELRDNPYDAEFASQEDMQQARERLRQRDALEAQLREALQAKLLAADQAQRYVPAIHDDNNDTFPEVNTVEEMKVMAWALKAATGRFDGVDLFFIRGASVFKVTGGEWASPYEDDLVLAAATAAAAEGASFIRVDRHEEREAPGAQSWDAPTREWQRAEIRIAPMYDVQVEETSVEEVPLLAEFADRLSWTVSHGVEPAKMALGAQGCADCHAKDSHFYFGRVVVDPYTEDGTPGTAPMYTLLGYDPGAIRIGIWRETVLKPWSPYAVLVVLAMIILHFVIFGVKTGKKPGPPDVVRFRLHERLGHLAAMATVVFLAITGFCFLLGKNDPLAHWARPWHTYFGYAASAGVVLMMLFWFISMLPARGDLKWLMKAGGYLGGVKGHLPAGKFNAGQKALFWLVMLCFAVLIVTGVLMGIYRDAHFEGQELFYTLHDIAGLGMIVLLMAHVYLATIVVPHSLFSLFGGKVSSIWAKEHHADWKFPEPDKEAVEEGH